MAYIVQLSCPHCGANCGSYDARDERFGSPLLACPRCGSEMVDPGCLEWEMLGTGKGAVLASTGCQTMYVLLLLGALAGTAVVYFAEEAPFALVIAAGLAAGCLGVAAIWWRFAVRLRRSKERMADPAYREKLLSLGLKVLDLRAEALQTFAHGSGITDWAGVSAYSPDDGAVHFWEAGTGRLLRLLWHHFGVNTAAFSPDGRLVLTGDTFGSGRLWDLHWGRDSMAPGQASEPTKT